MPHSPPGTEFPPPWPPAPPGVRRTLCGAHPGGHPTNTRTTTTADVVLGKRGVEPRTWCTRCRRPRRATALVRYCASPDTSARSPVATPATRSRTRRLPGSVLSPVPLAGTGDSPPTPHLVHEATKIVPCLCHGCSAEQPVAAGAGRKTRCSPAWSHRAPPSHPIRTTLGAYEVSPCRAERGVPEILLNLSYAASHSPCTDSSSTPPADNASGNGTRAGEVHGQKNPLRQQPR